jgi:hypothetical protein
VGGKVPLQLKPHADGVIYAWPICALLGAVGVVWVTEDTRRGALGDGGVQRGGTPQGAASGSGSGEVFR